MEELQCNRRGAKRVKRAAFSGSVGTGKRSRVQEVKVDDEFVEETVEFVKQHRPVL